MNSNSQVVDACGLINIFASGREEELIRENKLHLVISPQVRLEVRYIRGPIDATGQKTKISINLGPLEAEGRLREVSVAEEFSRLLVEGVTAGLREADASAVALAQGLSLPLLSDDRKVRKKAKLLYPQLELRSTLDLIKEASQRLAWDPPRIRQVLLNLRERGSFLPPNDDPLRPWHAAMLKSG